MDHMILSLKLMMKEKVGLNLPKSERGIMLDTETDYTDNEPLDDYDEIDDRLDVTIIIYLAVGVITFITTFGLLMYLFY